MFSREKDMIRQLHHMTRGLAVAVLAAGALAVASVAQAADPSWLDKDLLAKAKKAGGTLTVYGSMNEEEALPFWKMFDEITGLKTSYVRASDVKLMARITVERRAGTHSWDLLQTTAVNKLPQDWIAQTDPKMAKDIPPIAKDKNKRWYGVYANYNGPAFNTNLVKKSELPKTYEDFLKKKEWKGKLALDCRDNEWLKALSDHFGEAKATKLLTDMNKTLAIKCVRGHGGLARSTGAGEHAISLNNYVNLSIRVGLRGNPIDWWVMDPVAVFYGQIGMNANAPHKDAAMLGMNFLLSKEGQTQLAKSGRIPTRTDVTPNPPDVLERINKAKVVSAVLDGKEERVWQKKMDAIFGGRKRGRR
jgi:iron(III) transport system substrate-binding protein